jgi:hypothetical protein
VSGKIGITLCQLQEYQIICNYSECHKGDSVEVYFDYVDEELVELLSDFEECQADTNIEYKRLKFIPLNGGLKITNRLVTGMKLYESLEGKKQINVKINFMKDLLKAGYISNLKIEDEGTVSFIFKDEETMHLLKTQGIVLELIVYHLMRESGLFDDVETGVKISWDINEKQSEPLLLNEIKYNYSKQIGYKNYLEARTQIFNNRKCKYQISNEVDVVGISGMGGVMVSCKTSDKDSMQWLYEINSVSERFQSCAVMAVSSDYSNTSNSAFLERAKQMNISIWGTETLWNPDKMRSVLQEIVKRLKR